MNPREFQAWAKTLEYEPESAACRSIISRAYYAVFHVGREHLEVVVPITRGPAAHGQVRRVLSNCSDKQVEDIGHFLGDLHGLRIDADYDMRTSRVDQIATSRHVLNRVDELIGALDRKFSGPGAETIRKAAQDYWVNVLKELLKDRKRL